MLKHCGMCHKKANILVTFSHGSVEHRLKYKPFVVPKIQCNLIWIHCHFENSLYIAGLVIYTYTTYINAIQAYVFWRKHNPIKRLTPKPNNIFRIEWYRVHPKCPNNPEINIWKGYLATHNYTFCFPCECVLCMLYIKIYEANYDFFYRLYLAS